MPAFRPAYLATPAGMPSWRPRQAAPPGIGRRRGFNDTRGTFVGMKVALWSAPLARHAGLPAGIPRDAGRNAVVAASTGRSTRQWAVTRFQRHTWHFRECGRLPIGLVELQRLGRRVVM